MENLLKSTFSDLPPCLWQALSVGSATSHDSGLSSDDLAGFSLWPLGWKLGDGFPWQGWSSCRPGFSLSVPLALSLNTKRVCKLRSSSRLLDELEVHLVVSRLLP